MTSPLAGATLTAQRAQNRWKTYHLAISQPNTVFTARINQAFDTVDGVSEFIYDGGTGTYTDVKPGMTCFIGSAAGLFDVGVVRVRKLLTTTVVYIGRVSDVAFANNLYLTFVDDFQPWSRVPLVTDTLTLIDLDVPFDAVLSFGPVVKLGPIAYVLEMTGADIDFEPTATIYSPTGATAASYLWTAPGASAVVDMDTASPTITYDTDGEYYVSCTVTDSNGGISTATRKVLVNPDEATISPPEITGDIDTGGWSCRIEGYAGVDVDTLADRALCVLWKKDYKSTARDTSYGPYSAAENIRLVGWLDGESLSINPDFGTASFTIQGPAFWMDRIDGAPMSLVDAVTPTTWNEIASMTTDKALYRLLHWQSTITAITDVTFTGNETTISFAIVNSGSIRAQADGLANEKILARLCFDRFGCGRFAVPQSMQDSAGKSALVVLWDCASSDWIEQVNIDRETVPTASMVEVGGTSWDGTTETEIYSRAPGNIPSRHGESQAPYSTLAVIDQDEMNQISGDCLALQNSEYPTVDLSLYWPNDFIDFSSYIVRLSVAAGDTPRGIEWNNKRLVPQSISYDFDPDTGAESTVITLAEETTGTPGVFYMPPQPPSVEHWNPPVTFPPFFPPPSTWFPPTVPPEPPEGECGDDAKRNNFGLSFDLSEISGDDDVLSTFCYFPCKIRAVTATNGTSLEIGIEYRGDAVGKVHCYAIDSSKNRILTGDVTPPGQEHNYYNTTHVGFAPISETDVAGFEIELEAGLGSILNFTIGDEVASGVQGATDVSALAYGGLVIDDYYSIENTGGPWSNGGGTDDALSFVPDNVVKKGIFGFRGWLGGGAGFSDTLSDLVQEYEYTRVFFKAEDVEIYISVADNVYGDNSGSIGWIIREATLIGRKIIISGGFIRNVCKQG